MGGDSVRAPSFAGELERLARNWRRFFPGCDPAEMGADVAARAEAVAHVWDLEEVKPLGGGEVALVCAAVKGGRPVVLKVQPRAGEDGRAMRGEAVALRAWEGSGAAVGLLAADEEGLTLLLERLSPGTPLDETGADAATRMRLLAEVALRLHRVGAGAPAGMVGLADYCESWRAVLGGSPAEVDELDALLASSTEQVVLHGDLHGGNVLRHGSGWMAIDPHAVVGERSAEIWSLIDPLSPALGTDRGRVRAAVAAFASAAGLDPGRAARWARLRALAEAATIERDEEAEDRDQAWAAKMRRFAAALERD